VETPAEDQPAWISVVFEMTAEPGDGEHRVADGRACGEGFWATAFSTWICFELSAAVAGTLCRFGQGGAARADARRRARRCARVGGGLKSVLVARYQLIGDFI
jgi:hypothetical protein